MPKILYTSDIHGNESQYKKLIDYAKKTEADFIIIGGDIAPKHFQANHFIAGQRDFLKDRLPDLLSPLKTSLSNAKLFLMMGNDDCIDNMDVLKKYNNDLYQIIHNKRMKLNDDFDIAGYGFVPITPFGIKDWEKYDFSNVPKNMEAEYSTRKKSNYRLKGLKSKMGIWENFDYTYEIEKQDSIQKDLEQGVFLKKPKKTIYIFHCPPNNTNLDITSPQARSGGAHVGSMALRLFIEKSKPYLTLHGHIHETVEMSGKFKDKIGDTICLASGNHNIGNELALLMIELNNINRAKRIII
jgi:Icc-related predicted phosphoesterase